MKSLPSIILILTLVACVGPKNEATEEELAVFSQMRDKYKNCLLEQTALYINRSDDDALLVKIASSKCSSHLQELRQAIRSSGFPDDWADRYVHNTRELGVSEITSLILLQKAKSDSEEE
jgi:hypothetical protein